MAAAVRSERAGAWLDPRLSAGVVIPDPFAAWDPRLPISAFNERAQRATDRARRNSLSVPAGSAWSNAAAAPALLVQHEAPVGERRRIIPHSAERRHHSDDAVFVSSVRLPDVLMEETTSGGMRPHRRTRTLAPADGAASGKQSNRRRTPTVSARAIARAILEDDGATVSQLRSALRSLLKESDTMAASINRSARVMAEERSALAAEISAFTLRMMREIERLRRRERFWGGGSRSEDEVVHAKAPLVETSSHRDDVLRSGTTNVTAHAARKAIEKYRAPTKVPTANVQEAAAELQASLTRREQGRAAKILAAAVAEAQAGEPEALLNLLHDGPFISGAAARALDQTLMSLDTDNAMNLRMRILAARGEAMLIPLLTPASGMNDATGRRKSMAVQLAALNALEALVENCPPACTGFIDAGGGEVLASLLRDGSAPHPTSIAVALLPHTLHLLIALGGASRAGAADQLRRIGCVEAVLPLLDRGLEDRSALLAVAALKAIGIKCVSVLCRGSPRRLTTLRALWVLDKLYAPIARRRALAEHDAGRHPGVAVGLDGNESGALAKMMKRKKSHGRTLRLHLRGDSLKKMDWLSESDPLCVVLAELPGGRWREIARTEHIDDEPNPRWQPLECRVPEGTRRLKLQVVDYEGPVLPARMIGQAIEAVDKLLSAKAPAMCAMCLTTAAGKGGRGNLLARAEEVRALEL